MEKIMLTALFSEKKEVYSKSKTHRGRGEDILFSILITLLNMIQIQSVVFLAIQVLLSFSLLL